MKVEEIHVTISPDGEVSIEVQGMTGMSCLTATAELERLLGGEVVRRDMKAEAYNAQQETQSQRDWNKGSW